jgi:predicted metal-dependent hydrolase
MLADGVLRNPAWFMDAEPALRRVWEWHSVEELEHKAVAFDAYRAAGGGYLRRVLWFLYVSLMFWTEIFIQTTHNLHRDGALWRPGTWVSAARMWFGRRGLAWHMAGPVLRYFSPRFHPWQHDNRALLAMWLDRNSGAYRALRSTEVRAAP